MSFSIPLIFSVASIKIFCLFSHYVKQVYPQSKDSMSSRICIRLKRESLEIMDISENEILELSRPFDGTSDVGDYWGVIIYFEFEEDLGMKPRVGDAGRHLNGKKKPWKSMLMITWMLQTARLRT